MKILQEFLKKEKEFAAKHGENIAPEHHPYIRDEESCYLSSSLATSLAKNITQIYMFCI